MIYYNHSFRAQTDRSSSPVQSSLTSNWTALVMETLMKSGDASSFIRYFILVCDYAVTGSDVASVSMMVEVIREYHYASISL